MKIILIIGAVVVVGFLAVAGLMFYQDSVDAPKSEAPTSAASSEGQAVAVPANSSTIPVVVTVPAPSSPAATPEAEKLTVAPAAPAAEVKPTAAPATSEVSVPAPSPAPAPQPAPAPAPAPSPSPAPQPSGYPVHTNITATVFWVGEPQGGGSSEDNALSAWDDEWQANFGGYDDYQNRNGYYPAGFTPRENPFYLDLPYNDFNNNGSRRANAYEVVPWAGTRQWGNRESMMKNRWVKITRAGATCYGQIEDAGPYVYDDANYVFGSNDARPRSSAANNAGMDVSPALRDCLQFNGLNNADNKVDWQFVDVGSVPSGPWKQIITTSQVNWP